jgi:hydrogenase nickel incorporation protein HypA/HybF
MHELAICQALMQQVDAIAVERNAQSVTCVTVGIGPLSGVEAQLLVNAFSIARAGTAASSSELKVEHLPVKVRCNSCEQESEVKPNKMTCAHCGDWRTTLVSGDELMLLSVELEQAVENTAVNS